MIWAEDREVRRRAGLVLWLARLKVDARRRLEQERVVQERIDEEGCGALFGVLRAVQWEHWP
ncbi:hypothetical protein [Tabrizicola thermarum]|uniref:hypothetical protein n=1 Tax=Tabrizicola thermarum TaxID=2670345 RepID=UPI0012D7ED3A|nr:hypothetical protein [Tabrizicola thermarum]